MQQVESLRLQVQAEITRRRVNALAGGWADERKRCAASWEYWFDNYAWTYDPRLIGKPGGAYVRFILWQRQRELLTWLHERVEAQEEGLIEKSRDIGASYLLMGYAVWRWLFSPGFKSSFGSYAIDKVDQKNNPDTLLAKARIILDRMPPELMPDGWSKALDDNFMRIVNRADGSMISGEGGSNMGRGGRSSMYALDEAAFVENAEDVEAALSGNTDCVIWASTVNGMGNLFARKRHSVLAAHQIFRFHWRSDPRKDDAWAAKKQASFTDPTKWASEYEIDYSASVPGICIPALWVAACQRIRQLVPLLQPSNAVRLGLDVGAGKAKSVVVPRAGPVVMRPQSRGDPDTTGTAHWALGIARELQANRLDYDAPGVGAGVSSTLSLNPLTGLEVFPINTGLPPSEDTVWPDERTSLETFGNLKAEIWWMARTAAQRTYEHLRFLEGDHENGRLHPLEDLLSLPSGDKDSDQLALELSLVKWGHDGKGKIVIEQKQALAKRGIASPDYADALMLSYVVPERVREARSIKVSFG